ncbi:choice-of-anchor L domain-containing protein [Mariniflexile gromovii]|uniref:T9SS type B sorting domain-containing protein n=1 Tax=Mariniflexile gromovii TaxID=362523 RepID=A0ABS4BV15_9FLAO|nr:choice-of-anchor L domain-containing protein [Mariniflexile gromovii]MBP0903910.1 T9SS type B sorting domain-containing protein [Mariniflexile gromovii]
MKHFCFLSFFFTSLFTFGQNVLVNSNSYTPQQLIEDILIGSNCISNVVVTNVSGGNFGGSDQSYGAFDANGSTFPFQNGIVLSTGRLSNVEGPNNSLSDDDANNWFGDSDLENILNENNTTNATVIEFEFTSIASQVSFRYLFASEEYQINNANTCQYSDLFGFLIRNVNDTQYTNIALIPNTQTPVKVTTVHPNIPNGCAAQNEAYFGSWNNASAPINFNGQTAILTATANTIPNETYHVKLVIADEQNYRYDSAVFLEAGSFQLSTDLGIDRLISTNNPLCENETLQLDANQPNATSYKWFKDGIEIIGETNDTYTVVDAGIYNVEVTLQGTCISYGDITVEYTTLPSVDNTTLIACDDNQDGLSVYNLNDAEQAILNNDNSLTIVNYFLNILDAEQNSNEITNPSTFNNTTPQQIVYARVENQNGCFAIAEITLEISNNNLTITPFEVCDTDNDGFATFNLDDLKLAIQPNVPANASISFYKTLNDFFNETNELNGNYNNVIQYSESLFVKIKNGIDCYALSSVELKTMVSPQLLANETTMYCLNTFPNTITIDSGLQNGSGNNLSYQWFLNSVLLSDTSSSIQINETGTYTALVTFANNCTSSRDIIVTPSKTATIQSILVSENTITITVSGEGNYQYALDHPIFQDENRFTNVTPAFHTVYVYDVNGCGTVQKSVAVLGFPKFFTPNNDGFNDTWKPLGVNAQFNNDVDIKIFNRYGKLIKQINTIEAGWNGTYNGNMCPNDDYWYLVVLPDGSEYKGHFSLKR